MIRSRRASSGALRLTASSAGTSRKKASSLSATPTVLTVRWDGANPNARGSVRRAWRRADGGEVVEGFAHAHEERCCVRGGSGEVRGVLASAMFALLKISPGRRVGGRGRGGRFRRTCRRARSRLGSRCRRWSARGPGCDHARRGRRRRPGGGGAWRRRRRARARRRRGPRRGSIRAGNRGPSAPTLAPERALAFQSPPFANA